jgi:transcription elongation factor GreB
LREIDAKIHRLQKLLESFEVVDPATRPRTDRVFFGATVTVEDEEGEATTYQVVGPDELDESLGENRISFEAPLGRALLGRREGDSVRVRRPAGEVELTIVRVEWV